MKHNIFKQSAILIKDNLLIIQPVFFWFLITMLVLTPVFTKNSFDIGVIIALSIAFLCFTAFLSGWYNCIKEVIKTQNDSCQSAEERNKIQISILGKFFPGVSEYMLPVTVLTILNCLLGYIFSVSYKYLFLKVLSNHQFPADFMNKVNTLSQIELAKYFQNSLTHEQLIIFTALMVGAGIICIIFLFISIWFYPALFYKCKNPFIAMFEGIKFLFQNIWTSFKIILVMSVLYICISFISIFTGNGFWSFIPLILFFTYTMYYVTTVFLYYESKTQNSCSCGAKFDRQV